MWASRALGAVIAAADRIDAVSIVASAVLMAAGAAAALPRRGAPRALTF